MNLKVQKYLQILVQLFRARVRNFSDYPNGVKLLIFLEPYLYQCHTQEKEIKQLKHELGIALLSDTTSKACKSIIEFIQKNEKNDAFTQSYDGKYAYFYRRAID